MEFGARAVDVDSVSGATDGSGDIDIYTVMVNGVWDWDVKSRFEPYVLLGAGVIIADGDISYTDGNALLDTTSFSKSALAGQIGLGLRYGISDRLDLTGGYTFLLAPTNQTNKSEVVQLHSLALGLDIKF